MQTYTYTARNPMGSTIDGEIDAATREEALQLLRRDGFQVMRIAEDEDDGSLLPRRIKRSEIIYATSQLAIMVDTGIRLSEALEGIANQEENPSLKTLLLDLKAKVEGGDDFSTALAQYPKQFDYTYVSLVKASEQTGLLAEMLERIAEYQQKESQTRSKVRGAMAYPAVMGCLAVGVTIFLLTFVLPKFEPLFNRRGQSLPMMTQVLMVVSDALLGYWFYWVPTLMGAIGGLLYARRTEKGRQAYDWLKLRLPIIGLVYKKVTISRTIRTLGTLLESGISILDAIHLASEVAGNYYYSKLWLRVMDQVTQGTQLCEALQNEDLLPSTLVQMIAAGEQTGKLDEVLNRLSDYYDQEVDTSIKTATSLIEPLMITVMGVVVGGIAMGLLMPIFSLSQGH